MSIIKLLKILVERDGSDLFCRAGGPPRLKIDGRVTVAEDKELSLEEVISMVEEITTLGQRERFNNNFDVDFAWYAEDLKRRFRISIFKQRNWPSIVIRNIRNVTHTFEDLGLPAEILTSLSMERRGLVLLTGSVGSGKSTTIASMIEYINTNAQKHVLTIEEPIEFNFQDKQSIINQRELSIDVSSYAAALRAFTLQSPDVIFIGNIRDYETMSAALTAAETGVLVLSTLHTINAAQSVERIVNFFPPYQHQQVRIQLSYLLKGVISQRLVPLKDKAGRIPAYEVMLLTPTIGRLIREGKVFEMAQFIESGANTGMISFNQCLVNLVREGKLSEQEAVSFADNRDEFTLTLKGIRKA